MTVITWLLSSANADAIMISITNTHQLCSVVFCGVPVFIRLHERTTSRSHYDISNGALYVAGDTCRCEIWLYSLIVLDCDPLEMCKLSKLDSFPSHQSLNLCITHKLYQPVIAILCSTLNWTEAFFYHLKSLLMCQGHLKDDYCKTVRIYRFLLLK